RGLYTGAFTPFGVASARRADVGAQRQLYNRRRWREKSRTVKQSTPLRNAGIWRTLEHPLKQSKKHMDLLTTLAVLLLILWLLGLVTSYTLSGFIHILLVVAIVMILVRIISGRRV